VNNRVESLLKTVLVVFGFGEPFGIGPNQRLAAELVKAASDFDVDVVCTDRDIAPLLEGRLPDGVTVYVISPKTENDEGRPSTWRLAVLAAETVQEMGADTLHVMYARPHLRAWRDTWWALSELDLKPTVLKQKVKITFDPKATTVYTRWLWLWLPLEIGVYVASWLMPRRYKSRSA
jgi:hypothetical protein